MSQQQLLERGLPANLDAERFVLGSILLDESGFVDAAATLSREDFSIEKHRRIWLRMADINGRGERIDRVTLANELKKFNELESCDGLTYLISLDDGLPHIPNLDSYIRIVKQKSALRQIINAAQSTMNRCLLGEQEPQEILATAERSLLKITDSQLEDDLKTAGDVLGTFEGGISSFLDPSKRLKGISTGFHGLDELAGGLHVGDLFVLAARPSMGKTAMAVNIAQHVAIDLGEPAVIFSLEMSTESLLARMVCSIARVDGMRYRLGYCNQEERRRINLAVAAIAAAPLYIDDTSAITPKRAHAKLRRLAAKIKRRIGLVVVDYAQLMGADRSYENRNQEVSAMSRAMKLMAKELPAPVMLLSQLSREVEKRKSDHRPQLSDLRESGSIEQDADEVGFIFREEVYQRDREDLRGLAELILAKQRNGPTGTINLVFLHSQTKFENRADDLFLDDEAQSGLLVEKEEKF